MPTNSDSDLADDEWSDDVDDSSSDDLSLEDSSTDGWLPPVGESRRLASRRAIEIAREERELRMALDDFSEHG